MRFCIEARHQQMLTVLCHPKPIEALRYLHQGSVNCLVTVCMLSMSEQQQLDMPEVTAVAQHAYMS